MRCFICHYEGHIAHNYHQNKDATPKTLDKTKKYFPKFGTQIVGLCLDIVKLRTNLFDLPLIVLDIFQGNVNKQFDVTLDVSKVELYGLKKKPPCDKFDVR